jgi:diamine N-acetyltransferase
MEIKAIQRDEISRIKTWWEALNAHHLSIATKFKDLYRQLTFEKRMKVLKRREGFIGYVAHERDEDIGYCIASVDDLVGEIDSIFIKAEQRRKGIGTELITLAIHWLQNQKCETIRVAIAEGNENALDFYRRFGFEKRMTVMQKIVNLANT